VGLKSVVAVLASRRPRLGTPVVLGLALLATGAASAGAVVLDVQSTHNLRRIALPVPTDPSWVDRARVGPVTLLQSYTGVRGGFTLQELFWNRSIERVALLPGAARFDAFRTEEARVADDGSLSVNRRPLRGPVLVETYGSTVLLQDAHVVEGGPTATLWLPDRDHRPRLRLYALGRYADGLLAQAGVIFVWPSTPGRPVSGWLSTRLTASQFVRSSSLTFQYGPHLRTTVRVTPDRPQIVRIPLCTSKNARVTFRAKKYAIFGGRAVSVEATAPVFIPSRRACPRTTSPRLTA
jgi:hypothetical protein